MSRHSLRIVSRSRHCGWGCNKGTPCSNLDQNMVRRHPDRQLVLHLASKAQHPLAELMQLSSLLLASR